jgi:multiple sugar transport system permease protein
VTSLAAPEGTSSQTSRKLDAAPTHESADRSRRLRWFRRQRTREAIAGYLFVMPWLVGFFGLLVFPLCLSLWYSFTNYSILGQTKFVGLTNYRDLIHDALVKTSAFNTAYMVVIGLPIGLGIALALALLMDVEVRGKSLYRMLLYLPAATPVVAGSLLWVWVLNGQGGLLNDALGAMHLGTPNWLGTPTWSKPSIILMTIWASTGPTVVILLAGLKNISITLYEAASLDGAGRLRKFRHVTLPMLSPTLFFLIVTGLIASFQIFTQSYVATNGGPVNSTLFYVYYLFNVGFGDFRMGYASALAWVLFVTVVVITILQFRFAKRWVHYD